MSALYLDSSAFVRLHLAEHPENVANILEAVDRHEKIVMCSIGYAEVCSAIARNYHEGRMTDEEFIHNIEIFEGSWAAVNQVGVIDEISRVAGQLLKAHQGLRAMDALHLAAALWFRKKEPIEFLTYDQRLRDIAQKIMPEAVL